MEKTVVGVKFRESGKVFYFEPGEVHLEKGDSVIVETSNGEEFGNVVLNPRTVPAEKVEDIFPIVRKANQEDLEYREELLERGEAAKDIFIKEVARHRLGMKLIDVTYTFDTRKIIFYYTADGRVDFRDLVRDLAGYFHARIELRQIGARDEARKYSGIGVCGRECCCSSWLSDFVPVSIKMAKEQNLSLNSTKISGVCGRLLCCLKYEEDYYEEVSKKMPRIGDQLKTPDGMGTVYKLNTLDQAVLMKVKNQRDEMEIKRFTLEELEKAAKEPEVKEIDPEVRENGYDSASDQSSQRGGVQRGYGKKRKRVRRKTGPRVNRNVTYQKKTEPDSPQRKEKDPVKAQAKVTSKRSTGKKRPKPNGPRQTKRFSDMGKKPNKTFKKASTNRKRRQRRRPQTKVNTNGE